MQGGYSYGTSSGEPEVFISGKTAPSGGSSYHRNGRSFRESTRTEDKRIATRILGKRLAEISTNTFVGPTHERITVGELADDLFRDYPHQWAEDDG